MLLWVRTCEQCRQAGAAVLAANKPRSACCAAPGGVLGRTQIPVGYTLLPDIPTKLPIGQTLTKFTFQVEFGIDPCLGDRLLPIYLWDIPLKSYTLPDPYQVTFCNRPLPNYPSDRLYKVTCRTHFWDTPALPKYPSSIYLGKDTYQVTRETYPYQLAFAADLTQ